MSDQPQDPKLTAHEYDGIQEFDNPLPNWWLMTFIGCVIFAFLYYLHYEMGGGGLSMKAELAQAMSSLDEAKAAAAKRGLTPEEMMAKIADPATVTPEVAAAFKGKCAACHGQDLQGLIGPNLTDEFFIHGKGDGPALVKVITEGVAEKGMPPWGPILSQEEIIQLTAYILSKQDTHPAGAKAPQGEKVR